MSQPTQPSAQSRREFVKQSSMLAGGLIAAPFIGSATNYFSGAEGTIRIAIVGCGGRGTGAVMQALLTKYNVKLVAMADAFRDRLDNCYKTITAKDMSDSGIEGNLLAKIDVPEENKFTGFDAYQKAIPLADVVILTTPPGFRPIHFEEAIRQGKHVFMEKPVATDPAGVQKVLAAAAIAKEKKIKRGSRPATPLSKLLSRTF